MFKINDPASRMRMKILNKEPRCLNCVHIKGYGSMDATRWCQKYKDYEDAPQKDTSDESRYLYCADFTDTPAQD